MRNVVKITYKPDDCVSTNQIQLIILEILNNREPLPLSKGELKDIFKSNDLALLDPELIDELLIDMKKKDLIDFVEPDYPRIKGDKSNIIITPNGKKNIPAFRALCKTGRKSIITQKKPAIMEEKTKPIMIIDDIFLIYKDGRLIFHHTRKLKPDLDDEILGGQFTAIQDFIKTAFSDDEEKAVTEITYGDSKILIEHGQFIFIAAVITGGSSKEMQENMKAAIHNIEEKYRAILEGWSGERKKLIDIKKWLKMLISGETIQ